MNLYIIEDNKSFSEAIIGTLRTAFIVESFSSCKQALEKLKSGSIPDVILTDIYVAKENGLDMLAEIRTMGINRPAIVITGRAEKKFVLKAVELGVTDFLEKPFSLGRFKTALRRAQNGRNQQLALEKIQNETKPFQMVAADLVELYEKRAFLVEDALFAKSPPHFSNPTATKKFLDLVQDSELARQQFTELAAQFKKITSEANPKEYEYDTEELIPLDKSKLEGPLTHKDAR